MLNQPPNAFAQIPHRTNERPHVALKDKAYEIIKNKIITCEYQPGQCINEVLIANKIGIGRTPVHQALDRLRLEGMVEVMPRKGVIVKPVALSAFMQMIEVRAASECLCVRLAAVRASDDDVRTLRYVANRARAALTRQDINMLMSLDREFHEALAEAAKNDELAEILRRLHEQSLRFWFIAFKRHGHAPLEPRHDALVDAVERRDCDFAEAVIRQHMEAFREWVARDL